MASKLKIIPLGGLGEIGKNLTVYEYGKDMFLVDCGMGFPDQDLYGVDMVIPDISYLKANKNRIRGMVITHGHEDHIGAIPYVLKQLDMPIYATPLTAAIIELKLEEVATVSSVLLSSANKGGMVRRLADLLDVARENVICVGDHANDISMLTWAGQGYAPANAIPQVLHTPGVRRLPDCRDNAIAQLIRSLDKQL